MGACTSSAGAATVAEPGEPSARTVSLDSLRGKAVDGLVYNVSPSIVSPTANHLPRPESRFQSSSLRRDSHDSVESCSSRDGWRRGGGETPRRATLKSFLSNERDARESEAGNDTLTSEKDPGPPTRNECIQKHLRRDDDIYLDMFYVFRFIRIFAYFYIFIFFICIVCI